MGGWYLLVQGLVVLKHEPETNQWTLIAPMHEQRSDASATTLYGKVRPPGKAEIMLFFEVDGKQKWRYSPCNTNPCIQ